MRNYTAAVVLILMGVIIRFAFHLGQVGFLDVPLIGWAFIGAGILLAIFALAHDYMLSYGRGRVMRVEDGD